MRRLGNFPSDAWRLAGPYWRSEERWRARLLLGVVVALNLSLVGMSVLLSYWNREFFNSLQAKDADAFWALLFWWRQTDLGPMPGFVFVAALYILIAVYQLYLRQALQIRWRSWLTREVLDRWLADRAYYRVALTDPGTDNPDQRIAEDLRHVRRQHPGARPRADALGRDPGLASSCCSGACPGRCELLGIDVHPRLHGLGGAALCAGRHRPRPLGRPAADPAEFPAAARRGRLPLRPGAAARQCRGRGALRRRGGCRSAACSTASAH